MRLDVDGVVAEWLSAQPMMTNKMCVYTSCKTEMINILFCGGWNRIGAGFAGKFESN